MVTEGERFALFAAGGVMGMRFRPGTCHPVRTVRESGSCSARA